MAIKGKKRSQKRPKTTRPRPVAAARPATPARAAPFHRTFEGQFAAILIVLVLIGVVMFEMADRSAEAARDDARRETLSAFTDEIRALVGDSTQAVQEMNGAPFNTEDAAAIASLDDRAGSWVEALEGVGARAVAIQPPDGVEAVARITGQAFQAYSGAARTYRLVPDADGRLQGNLLERATAQRDHAGQLLLVALQILDNERDEVGMNPAGIQSPSTLPPIVPTPEATGDAGGGGQGDDGDGRRGRRNRNQRGD